MTRWLLFACPLFRLAHTAVTTSQRQEPAADTQSADTRVALVQRKQAQRDAVYKTRLEQLVRMLGPDAAARMLNHSPDVRHTGKHNLWITHLSMQCPSP